MLLVDFFRDKKNQHLATWVQTLAVIVGVIVGVTQLNTLIKQEQIKSNERYLDMEKQFSADISRKMGLIYEHYSNRDRLSDKEYSDLYTLEEITQTRRDVEIYISDLSSCGELEVCPKNLVDSTVCSHAKHLHALLSRELKLPKSWGSSFFEPVFYEFKINQHCGIVTRVLYWSNA